MAKQLRYMEIVQVLKERIREGKFPPGKALPSQKEIAQSFETSVMTVRQALAVLEDEGLISIIHGIGTFTASPGVHENSLGLQGFQNEMGKQKKDIENRIVETQYDISDSRIANIFNENRNVFSCLTRLRCLEGTPVILQRSWVSREHRGVVKEYTRDKSLYQFFSEHTGEIITLGRELVSPVLLEGQILELLELKAPCPAFLSRRISISLSGKVVLYDEAWLPGPHVIMASRKQGRNNQFKYIIKKEGSSDSHESFTDPSFWEDLG